MHHSIKVMFPLPEEQGVCRENAGCLGMVLPVLLLCLPHHSKYSWLAQDLGPLSALQLVSVAALGLLSCAHLPPVMNFPVRPLSSCPAQACTADVGMTHLPVKPLDLGTLLSYCS